MENLKLHKDSAHLRPLQSGFCLLESCKAVAHNLWFWNETPGVSSMVNTYTEEGKKDENSPI